MNEVNRLNLPEPEKAIAYLRSVKTIRSHTGQIYALAEQDKLQYFRLRLDKMGEVTDLVIKTILENYPDLNIPYHSRWRHFDVGSVNRTAALEAKLEDLSLLEKGRSLYELAIVSVLLDAGAGEHWSYLEAGSENPYRRSEGLAVASYHMFCEGLFSYERRPFVVDALGLSSLTEGDLSKGLQLNDDNTLTGLKGRLHLLQKLGRVVQERTDYFGKESQPRLGMLFDYFFNKAKSNGDSISAATIFEGVLDAFGAIWPGRTYIGDVNLGDVWPYPGIKGKHMADNLVPFHKLTLWLVYSLIEPLEQSSIKVAGLDELCGLAEYRNGGLFFDGGVLALKDPSLIEDKFSPSHPLIVEWRALTLCLLDKLAEQIRLKLHKSAEELPLAKVLQGGSWAAGRKLAFAKRSHGSSPINIDSDGTVF